MSLRCFLTVSFPHQYRLVGIDVLFSRQLRQPTPIQPSLLAPHSRTRFPRNVPGGDERGETAVLQATTKKKTS